MNCVQNNVDLSPVPTNSVLAKVQKSAKTKGRTTHPERAIKIANTPLLVLCAIKKRQGKIGIMMYKAKWKGKGWRRGARNDVICLCPLPWQLLDIVLRDPLLAESFGFGNVAESGDAFSRLHSTVQITNDPPPSTWFLLSAAFYRECDVGKRKVAIHIFLI